MNIAFIRNRNWSRHGLAVCLIPIATLLAAIWCRVSLGVESALPEAAAPAVAWNSDYGGTLDAAQAQRKFALLWFVDEQWAAGDAAFDRAVLQQAEIQARISGRFVAARLPIDAAIVSNGSEQKLLDHAAFAEMRGSPGLAIVDMTEPGSAENPQPLYRQVVSVLPFRQYPTREQLAVLLDLPRGTLTQRTLIYAVRTHAERPASTAGECSPLLAKETESHAAYQASLNLQGHHRWESRFHAINAKLPGGLLAQEVCAESWPGQSLVEAAIECVDSWRHSPGHWEAVSTRHELFGYDMKRGSNGVWYAAGIFATR